MTSIFRHGVARTLAVFAAAAAMLLLSANAFAGGFTVKPTRVFVKGPKKTAVLKVTNEGDKKADFQLSAVSWTQDDEGNNIFVDTKEIIFFPKIASINAGETKTIRLGYQGGVGAAEKTFRIFMQELPSRQEGNTALGFTVKISVPIFIAPKRPLPGGSVERVDLSGGTVSATFRNSGNAHVMINKVTAIALDDGGKEIFSNDTGGWYVLAGRSRTYSMDIPREQCLKAASIKAVVNVGGTLLERQVDLDSSRCGTD